MASFTLVWNDMGFIRWPLLVSFLLIVGFGVGTALQLFRSDASPRLATRAWLDAILFWGGFAGISGVLGTVVGVTIAAQAIEAAGDISTTLIWGGVKVAMLSSIVGLTLLGFAALLWFLLQLRWRFLVVERQAA